MIKVLLFAHLQEEAGASELTLEEAGMSVAQLKKHLEEGYQLSSLDQVMIAINENFAPEEEIVQDGDTVALIPPVSGG
ncbi:molybdopterin converting factor subunit 1 [Bacillus xiapuensis]|uniref:molybdopterin converting factor subunit 1 n=1 Tax=Bacillus xiapuensis TaxID=2014075 RepID=UPI000C24D582|nr:molybdopterin converting factor subunit 1 [Bacillus xiapuensis]